MNARAETPSASKKTAPSGSRPSGRAGVPNSASEPLGSDDDTVLEPDSAVSRSDRTFNGVTQHRRILFLTAGSFLGGMAALMIAEAMGQVWPIPVGAALWLLVIGLPQARATCRASRRLADDIERCHRSRRLKDIQALPTERPDELGRIASVFTEVIMAAERDSRAAARIRKAFTSEVERARQDTTKRLERLASRDALTNLGNRRFLEAELPELVRTSIRDGAPLVALAIDMDHFKPINDTLGHAAGDDLLKSFADLLQANVRGGDFAFRVGGDEFLVLMPDGSDVAAEALAGRLRTQFAQLASVRFAKHEKRPGISAGIAVLDPEIHADGKALIKSADDALYRAKRGGRGRTAA